MENFRHSWKQSYQYMGLKYSKHAIKQQSMNNSTDLRGVYFPALFIWYNQCRFRGGGEGAISSSIYLNILAYTSESG